ncbi:unnamed protein product [Acanthoscelides obtectus]|uniref:Uncharacterized protein n=1 Tax=Acanthoscelides obtectus TaxID=200917 RepID=A0A9P0QCY9_ACAOB|nr:unnamed protein product [Acanthoscelides obtectus]CAK1629800.1 hypothetical protein AOBTE_LOCUS5961 [Acanthoscelides obtectus]
MRIAGDAPTDDILIDLSTEDALVLLGSIEDLSTEEALVLLGDSMRDLSTEDALVLLGDSMRDLSTEDVLVLLGDSVSDLSTEEALVLLVSKSPWPVTTSSRFSGDFIRCREMSLPVSQYEALLAEVRGLRRKAQRVQQLARPLVEGDSQVEGAASSSTTASCRHHQVGAVYIYLYGHSVDSMIISVRGKN